MKDKKHPVELTRAEISAMSLDELRAFRDKSFCIHHGNDNWPELNGKNLSRLKNFSKGRKFL